MDLLTLFGWVLLILAFFVIALYFLDADVTLSFYDKFDQSKLNKYTGQVVWITGASMGIGAALAEECARHGAKLVLSARTEEKLQQVKQKCLEIGRNLQESDVLVLPMDVCDFDSHDRCLKQILQHFGRIDTVFLNAGRSQRARFELTEIAVDRDMFDLNVFSAVSLARKLIPVFALRGSGNLAVMSSVAGKIAPPFSASYCGSKFALHGYFEGVRMEKMGSGINITLLCPGPTFSNFLATAATEKAGQEFGGSMSSSDARMSTRRCAHLSLLAVANQLEEAWIAIWPVLLFVYIRQYMPTISKRLARLVEQKNLQKMRDSQPTVKQGQ